MNRCPRTECRSTYENHSVKKSWKIKQKKYSICLHNVIARLESSSNTFPWKVKAKFSPKNVFTYHPRGTFSLAYKTKFLSYLYHSKEIKFRKESAAWLLLLASPEASYSFTLYFGNSLVTAGNWFDRGLKRLSGPTFVVQERIS